MSHVLKAVLLLFFLPNAVLAESYFICPLLVEMRSLIKTAYHGATSSPQVMAGVRDFEEDLRRPMVADAVSAAQKRDLILVLEDLRAFAGIPAQERNVASTELRALQARVVMIAAELGCNARGHDVATRAAALGGDAAGESSGADKRFLPALGKEAGGTPFVALILLILLGGWKRLGCLHPLQRWQHPALPYGWLDEIRRAVFRHSPPWHREDHSQVAGPGF